MAIPKSLLKAMKFRETFHIFSHAHKYSFLKPSIFHRPEDLKPEHRRYTRTMPSSRSIFTQELCSREISSPLNFTLENKKAFQQTKGVCMQAMIGKHIRSWLMITSADIKTSGVLEIFS